MIVASKEPPPDYFLDNYGTCIAPERRKKHNCFCLDPNDPWLGQQCRYWKPLGPVTWADMKNSPATRKGGGLVRLGNPAFLACNLDIDKSAKLADKRYPLPCLRQNARVALGATGWRPGPLEIGLASQKVPDQLA